jgi:anaerobic ribonucleoside-triphosphate reductase
MVKITRIKKRDGAVVPFDRRKIERAIQRAADEVLRDKARSIKISSSVTDVVIRRTSAFKPNPR